MYSNVGNPFPIQWVLIGVGTDKQLYMRSTLTNPWQLVANSGPVISIAVMNDGTIVGVGTDKKLHTRATLTSPWLPVNRSMISVAVMNDGTIVGVGDDKQLYTRATLTSPWQLVANSGSVISIAQKFRRRVPG